MNSSFDSSAIFHAGQVLDLPEKIGTAEMRQAVTLLPQQEYVVWGKLPPSALVSPGSTVVVKPSSSRSSLRNIMVGWALTPMWCDRWVPLKVLSPTNEAVTLRCNAKVADVYPCVPAEDLFYSQGLGRSQLGLSEGPLAPLQQVQDPVKMLKDCGLHDINKSLAT